MKKMGENVILHQKKVINLENFQKLPPPLPLPKWEILEKFQVRNQKKKASVSTIFRVHPPPSFSPNGALDPPLLLWNFVCRSSLHFTKNRKYIQNTCSNIVNTVFQKLKNLSCHNQRRLVYRSCRTAELPPISPQKKNFKFAKFIKLQY